MSDTLPSTSTPAEARSLLSPMSLSETLSETATGASSSGAPGMGPQSGIAPAQVLSDGLSQGSLTQLRHAASYSTEPTESSESLSKAPSDAASGPLKRLFVRTYGCQMNVYDSERMTDVLAPLGYKATLEPDDADMIIINTCHVREKASEKLFSELGRMKKLKRRREQRGQCTLIAVAGCVAQAEGAAILKRAPFVDFILGPQTYHDLPQMMAEIETSVAAVDATTEGLEAPETQDAHLHVAADRPAPADQNKTSALHHTHATPSVSHSAQPHRPRVHTDFPVESKFDFLPLNTHNPGVSKFVAVQEGCDKFCTFCVVPYTRGAEFSRPVSQIVDEIQSLIDAGTIEITLLGQNVNAYHGLGRDGRESSLADLLYELSKLKGLQRLRYITSHPQEMTRDLILAHRDLSVLMPYLHLPLQAGSDRILASMNRQYTVDAYMDIISELRKARPDIALSSDFIVGFPGETDADFEATLAAVMRIGFAQSYSFKYSVRPGTPAGDMAEQIEEAVKDERLQILQRHLFAQQQHFNQTCIGKTLPVLLEYSGRQAGQWIGKSPYLQSVHVEAPEDLNGQMVSVKILDGHINSLSGIILSENSVTAAAVA